MHSYAFIKKCFTLISKPGKDIKEKRKTSNRKRDKETKRKKIKYWSVLKLNRDSKTLNETLIKEKIYTH